MLVSIFVIIFISARRDISTIIFRGERQDADAVIAYECNSPLPRIWKRALIGVITAAIVVIVALLARRFELQVMAQ
jgi:hypothetical protein